MTSHTPHLALPVSERRDHIRGPKQAPVTLVEYGDFECPYCGAAYPIVEEVRQRLGDDLRFVYRHFPLANAHPHAEPAAEASEAAAAQGRFWEMHDTLFEHQDALEDRDLLAYAQAIGLDSVRFVADLGEGAHVPRVREDFISGVRSGVNGTPSFFINGTRYDGPRDVESMVLAISQVHVVT
jgi:protein-disulfide isomerase